MRPWLKKRPLRASVLDCTADKDVLVAEERSVGSDNPSFKELPVMVVNVVKTMNDQGMALYTNSYVM
jgi:hypothetical protein